MSNLSAREFPVLLTDDDETVEVAWKERLTEGVYRLEIELLGNDGDVIERRETIIESDLSPSNVSEVSPGTENETSEKTAEKASLAFRLLLELQGLP